MAAGWRELLAGALRSPEGRAFMREIVAVFREELAQNGAGDEWMDQRSSQAKASLGRNRWCKVVRERLQRNPDDPHACHIGGRYLLDTHGLSEELNRLRHAAAPTVAKAEPAPTDGADGYEGMMRLIRGGVRE